MVEDFKFLSNEMVARQARDAAKSSGYKNCSSDEEFEVIAVDAYVDENSNNIHISIKGKVTFSFIHGSYEEESELIEWFENKYYGNYNSNGETDFESQISNDVYISIAASYGWNYTVSVETSVSTDYRSTFIPSREDY